MKKVLFILIVHCVLCFMNGLNAQEGEDRGYIVRVGDMDPDFTLSMDD